MTMRTNVIVVDDFLADPDAMRTFALAQTYFYDDRYYKGRRSAPERTNQNRQAFERLLGKTITKWDYPVNGAFQWTTPEDKLVYHMDGQEWAAVLYLTPNAPPECGTSFFRSVARRWRMDPRVEQPGETDAFYERETAIIFQGGFYDRTYFEEIDRVGNVYNRLVIWNAKMIHAASGYFGQGIDDARLAQVFFFDAQ